MDNCRRLKGARNTNLRNGQRYVRRMRVMYLKRWYVFHWYVWMLSGNLFEDAVLYAKTVQIVLNIKEIFSEWMNKFRFEYIHSFYFS